jgi:hypothetical protein
MSQEFYPFQNATMRLSAATIIPPIFNVEVSGEAKSLNPKISIVNTKKVKNNYLVLEVVGEDGDAIGLEKYKRSINVTKDDRTHGVCVVGLDKEVKLDWDLSNELHTQASAGLFQLNLNSTSNLLGAPILHLQLGVDTVNKTVSGIAMVTQPIAEPLVCTSHVTGNFEYESVMKPGKSMIRIDLSGYPEIHWPKSGGVGPVIPKNLSAMILLDDHWNNGTVQYQYLTPTGFSKEDQKIALAKASTSAKKMEPTVAELN